MISIIVAVDKNLGIGKNNSIPWDIPEDLKRFKDLTTGHPVIMGRKTWESIPEKFRPLPNRENIIISRNTDYSASGAKTGESIEQAIDTAKNLEGGEEIFIIGGGEIYKQALPHTDRLYLTIIDANLETDTSFPEYSEFKKEIYREDKESNGFRYTFLTLERG